MRQLKQINIIGTRRVGKDTFFNLLNKRYPNKYKRYAFADALKNDLQQLFTEQFGVDIHNLDGQIKEDLRPILIGYGTAWRKLDPLHWVKAVKENSLKSGNGTIPVVVDTRFENECLYSTKVYKDGVYFVRIKRQNGPEPTQEELLNDKNLDKYIDYTIDWPSLKEGQPIDDLLPFVEDFQKHLLNNFTF
jgi:hypothetical protein